MTEPGQPSEQGRILSIGSVVGGNTIGNRPWVREVDELTREVARVRGGLHGPLGINVVFHVPGHLLQPDFEGVRTGSYSKAKSVLMVQAALPEVAPPDPRTALLAFLNLAILEAERWSERRGVAFDPEPLRRIQDILTSE